jgi:prepilin signal peptidase PulO-like enzyme (type II secretory pathway)
MLLMIYLAPFLGFAVGILINLLADSLPSTRSFQRSHCHACGGPRGILGWSAILGSVARQGVCDYCGMRRRWRDFLVEILSIIGALGLAAYNTEPGYYLSTLTVGFIFLLIIVIDIEHRLILHIITFPAGVIFFVFAGLNPDLTYTRSLIGGAFGFILFFGLYLLGGVFGRWMAKRRGMDQEEVAFGFGDVTLATVIGLLLGFPAVIEALVRGILYAGVFSIGYLLYLSLRKRHSSFIPIPYGPFLILGALWVYFQGWTSLERLVGM